MKYIGKYVCIEENNCVPHGFFHNNEIVNVYETDYFFHSYSVEGKEFKVLIDNLSLLNSMYGLITIQEIRKQKLEKLKENHEHI